MGIKIRYTGEWHFAPRLRHGQEGGGARRASLLFMCFEITCNRGPALLPPWEAARRLVGSAGCILRTESDEQDKIYVANRSRGFEITYGDYEIILKNGELHAYRSDGEEITGEAAEERMINVNNLNTF